MGSSNAESQLPEPGDLVQERYRILRILGEGGSGVTYEAEDTSKENETGEGGFKKVAMKVLSLRRSRDWKALSLFEREAATLAALDHPYIPAYVDYFETDSESDRVFYIVQEIAQGSSLQDMVDSGWRGDEAEVMRIAEQLLEVVGYLETRRPPVVHRDIKPSNIIMNGTQGNLSLVDFGAAATAVQEPGMGGMRSTIVGTFGYMSPEQFRGSVTTVSDLYGVGGCIVFLLTGRPPSAFAQTQGLRVDVSSLQISSRPLLSLVKQLLEPLPEDRPSSAAEALKILRGDVVKFVGGTKNVTRRARKWPKDVTRKPAGSEIEVEESDGRLKIFLPKSRVSGETLTEGSFALAWNGFIGVWTAGALTAGAGAAGILFAGFSLPFWVVGATLAQQTLQPLFEETSIEMNEGTFTIQRKVLGKEWEKIEGFTEDIDDVDLSSDLVVNGQPQYNVIIREGVRNHTLGGSLRNVEKEWMVAKIKAFVFKRDSKRLES
eukprot:CAMPEP_0197844086 /NCGR_PEP_ID=MMETSP1438-20131217/1069_1 /TAXON_ID=1461541 /ORGANISM="Pterosperma sp., Strain CCMP1384" /LENGTH=489 /DNA_ID=CAMNT_0043454663 /DNA_START=411 /DNA_END=1880 /DNA_ORIENTATION=+